jgi:vitamin B12 transporter
MYTSSAMRQLFVILLTLFLAPSAVCYAQSEEEMQILRMYFKEDELVVSSTRQPKPVSQVAEDIIVITAREIELINAHTLADVLIHIPGVEVDAHGGPGTIATARIQG